jgi:Ras-related protein Rab-24
MATGSVDLKLVLLGHKNVGKTCIFNRYVYDKFGRTSMTIGAYFGMKDCPVDTSTRDRSGRSMSSVSLAIWDTAGEEKFDSLTNFYCRGARAAVICYDLTNLSTFEGLSRWVQKVVSQAHENCAVILVGNKLDIVEEDPSKRQVTLAQATAFAETIGADIVEASAKTSQNVAEAFQRVVRSSFIKGGEIPDPQSSLDINAEKPSGGCC